jgi:flagellar protein FliS
MPTDHRQSYADREVLDARGCRLVILLYEKAIDSVAAARVHLRQGRIRDRSEKITQASEILNELALSVNHEAGGEVSRNLVELYAYLQTLLNTANTEQVEAPLQEAESLLTTLVEAWRSCDESSLDANQSGRSMTAAQQNEYAPVDFVG